MDRIGDIYRNLPRRADVIVTTVGARHKCQQGSGFEHPMNDDICIVVFVLIVSRLYIFCSSAASSGGGSGSPTVVSEPELENRNFNSTAGTPPCAAAPLSQAHERARWRDCRGMAARDVRQMVVALARRCTAVAGGSDAAGRCVKRAGRPFCVRRCDARRQLRAMVARWPRDARAMLRRLPRAGRAPVAREAALCSAAAGRTLDDGCTRFAHVVASPWRGVSHAVAVRFVGGGHRPAAAPASLRRMS
ncbi:hypothetical protein F511_29430 [Dorcoceras hygrometricum]|uniref:Uncharacterized protein n=1 Tax=Dorcoceras hygrometricum TaxID=472368 RepID=A0A2Z7DEU3_9LAMI|nr:hypothetical protein F511_29430 [Dorcoceras hygrometricum]